ncbi:MAG: hypothetical protein ABR567_03560 [Myxococcales bacterium]|nr:hypothetical protein [Myxococcales bacterium]
MKRTLFIAALFAAAPAFAQWPEKPKTETNPPTTAATPAPSPTPPPRRPRATSSEDSGSGFGFGVRGAWAFARGDITPAEPLGNSEAGQLPLWVEAGYWFNRSLFAGAYYQYALGFPHCLDGSTTCSSSGMRFGIEVLYNFMPDASLQPWVGLGAGYEIFNRSRFGDETYKGFELLNLQIGLDFPVGKAFTLGPFASYQLLGKYGSFSASGVSNDIADSTGHSWLQVGLKAGFRL